MNPPSLLELLKAGVHFGHQTGKWHPKMAPYIFAERNGIHVIDLEKTQVALETAGEFIQRIVAKGGVVLFVGTKAQAKGYVVAAATDCGMPHIAHRWLGGTLTNFPVILKLIKKYKDLTGKLETGGLRAYTKREQLEFQEEADKLKVRIGGIAELKKIPDVVFIVDLKREKTALTEAKKKGLPIVAMCDTNVNPTGVQYIIPANDDAAKSIELITAWIASAVKAGQAEAEVARQKQGEFAAPRPAPATSEAPAA
ncbi:MAG: 30S ribosomal protein S2 [Patescibacteria group bacterium]